MSDSVPRSRRTLKPGAGELRADAGQWGLDLWNGSALVQRLVLPTAAMADRRPAPQARRPAAASAGRHLGGPGAPNPQSSGAEHPLDAEIRVEVGGGIQWWRVQGVAEHNNGGQPVYLAGSARDITAERRPDTPEGET